MSNDPNAAKQVAILMFNDCDLLDTGGPYEVFLTASRLAERDGLARPFDVETVTIDGQPVIAYGGLGLVPSAPPESLEDADLVIVPGAIDLDAALTNAQLAAILKQCVAQDATTMASVCTGAFLLGAVGALDGKAWTTHWEDIDLLSEIVPSGGQRGVRWVDNGSVVTGGALSSGIAMALHLVSQMASVELAERTALQLDYEWNNTSLATCSSVRLINCGHG